MNHYGNWLNEAPSGLRPVQNSVNNFTATDFVDIFFEHAVIPVSVLIYENFNPGSIVRILGCYREADSKQPINTRRLRWLTLWKAPNCRYPPFLYKPEFVQMFHLHMNGIHTPLLELLKLKEVDVDCIPPSLRFSARNEARIFESHFNNLPMLPLDLIRIEVDTRLCSNYVELDAVELVGWARVPPPECPNWAKHIFVLAPPSTEFAAREEEFLFNRFLLPPLNFILPATSSTMSVQSYSTLPLPLSEFRPLPIAEASNEMEPLTLPILPSCRSGVEIEELPCVGLPLRPLKRKTSIPALYSSSFRDSRSGPLMQLNRINSFHEPQFTQGYSVTLLPVSYHFPCLSSSSQLDILLRVFFFLDINSLCRAACVCKSVNTTINSWNLPIFKTQPDPEKKSNHLRGGEN
ncbi:F-box and leucine-rich repeat protein 4 [Cichlidogyrus casuarinus]|uniref:F-box and leucine-rich repeat protein 4 n=1 Tax=Cichlidogyrus casuarinus TaxID=1844966 RepID=A0ABD2PM86_9PLAT